MSLFGIRRQKSKTNLFLESFENVLVWQGKEIENNYGKRLSALLLVLAEIIRTHSSIDFLILFLKNNKRRCWYSENQDRVVINLNFYPDSPEFRKELQKAINDYENCDIEKVSSG